MANFDLHFHSTCSDGKLSVLKLADIIKQKKLEYCALADHNTVDGINGLMKCLDGSEIKVIPAVELTAKYKDNEVHILAYDFNVEAAAEILKERNEIVRRKKIEEMKTAIKLSRKEGLEVSPGLAPSEKQPVSLTIALDICANKFNQDYFLKKYGKRFMPEDIYYKYQAPGKSCAVERSGVTVEWLVQKFKGVAHDLIIAHPFVSESVVMKPLNKIDINNLLKIGLTGIEVYHNNTSDKQIGLLKKIVREKAIHYTGGSDFHGNGKDTPLGQYRSDCVIPDFYLSSYKFGHMSTPNTLVIQRVIKIIQAKFKNFKSIKSAYIYGSILTNSFHKKSDIDVLFIVKDIKDRCKFLRRVKAVRATVKDFRLDINIVFYSEFLNLWHIFRPPTFFVWIKQRNMLLWGVDCLRDIKEKKITAKSIYKRAVDLAQGCRAVYLNNKDVAFWETKYSRWLRELQYGILYLHGELELDSKLCGKKLCEAFPEIKRAKFLSKKKLPIKILSEIAEAFALCVYRNFIKKS